jgi:hypothetical protein
MLWELEMYSKNILRSSHLGDRCRYVGLVVSFEQVTAKDIGRRTKNYDNYSDNCGSNYPSQNGEKIEVIGCWWKSV